MKRTTRPRGHRLEVWVDENDRRLLKERAASAGLSMSAFLCAAGLNHPIRSTLDREIAADLMKLSGNQGRYGGLLKKWLAEKRGEGSSVADVNASLKAAREIQREILRLVCTVLGFK